MLIDQPNIRHYVLKYLCEQELDRRQLMTRSEHLLPFRGEKPQRLGQYFLAFPNLVLRQIARAYASSITLLMPYSITFC